MVFIFLIFRSYIYRKYSFGAIDGGYFLIRDYGYFVIFLFGVCLVYEYMYRVFIYLVGIVGDLSNSLIKLILDWIKILMLIWDF